MSAAEFFCSRYHYYSEMKEVFVLARPEKEQIVAYVAEKLEGSKAAVVTHYRGLNVAEATELRNKLREAGVEYKVVKNTLARIAASQTGLSDLNQYLTGPTAIAFSANDPVAPAKVLSEYAKKHDNLKIIAGIVEGKVIDANGVKALAALPPKEVLVAKLLGSMQSPISGLVNVLQGNIRNLVYVLNAVREKKGA